VVLHHADVAAEDRSWFGPVPATSASRTLRATLKNWRSAILNRSGRRPARWTESTKVDEPAEGGCPRGTRVNYWTSRQTNARVEGFNTKAKLVKRRAYGYISFCNYRLRLLNAGGS